MRQCVVGICVALAAITFAVFGQSLTHQFINYDDSAYVFDNPVVCRGLTLKGIVWAFTGAHAANWHPLTWLSHMLDCQLYGLHPGGHHLTNVILHTATVILLFLVLRQMTGALWRSAIVAAVFAIHPLRVESVAWVAERKDVLSGLFFLLTIGAYVRYARHVWKWQRYGLVMLLFALGLMCKPMLVTLPLVLLLVGLLAVATCGINQAVGDGKTAFSGALRRRLRGDTLSAKWRHSYRWLIFVADAPGQRVGQLHGLSSSNGLAREVGSVLSLSTERLSAMGIGNGWDNSGRFFGARLWLAAQATVAADRMALVFGDVAAGVGNHPGRHASSCGPLHLSAADRDLCGGDMAGGRVGDEMAVGSEGHCWFAGRLGRSTHGLRLETDRVLAKQ